MKKLVSVFIAIIAFSAMMFTSCDLSSFQGEDPTSVIKLEKICFSKESMFLEAGEISEVSVMAYYTNGIKDTVTSKAAITSSDASALKYENGKVTALNDGKVSLNATFEGKECKCEITTSTIEKIEFTIASKDKDVFFIPGESVPEDDISVVAYYKAGGSKEVSATITSDDANVVAVHYDEDGNVSEIAAAMVQAKTTVLRASFTTVNGTKLTDDINVTVDSDPDYILDPNNPYKVHTDAEYAYDDDIVYFKFTSEYVSKAGKKTKTVDLTNTGNTDITSGYYITEPKTTFCDASLIKLCTGKIQLSEQASIHTIGVTNEDSTGVFVIYKTSSKIDTVYSNQFKLYTHPQLTYSNWSRGKVGENIVINWFANHLWLDEVEIVDNFGNRYTKDDIKTISHYSNPTQIYILPLKNPDMYNKTYTFTYGPEKRQCILTVGAAPQN